MRRAIWRSLYVQVLIGIGLGILLGIFWPHFAQQLKPLGDGFITLAASLSAVGHVPVTGLCSDPRRRSLHVRGARAHQPQWRGDNRGRQMVRWRG
jgi:aerobic C4-dicarboxylate transport protein